MEQLWQDYRDREVRVLVIDVLETAEAARAYVERSGFTFPVLHDTDGKVSASFAPKGVQPDLPRDQVPIASNLIIDPEGRIRYYSLLDSVHFDAKLVDLKARLDELLARD